MPEDTKRKVNVEGVGEISIGEVRRMNRTQLEFLTRRLGHEVLMDYKKQDMVDIIKGEVFGELPD